MNENIMVENRMKLTIAFLQLLPTGCLKGNMEKGIKACLQAKEKGADIAIFPEMWSCGYAFPHDKTSLRECSIPCDSFFVKQFSGLAKELDMAIAITLLEKHEPKPRNTVCLFDRYASHLQAATALLHFAGKSAMLDAFDEELFEQTVDRIIVQSRSEFVFELKCGLKLKERM